MSSIVGDSLVEIFSFLHPRNGRFILNCRLVCKDWNHEITTSKFIWSNFRFCISDIESVPKKFLPLLSYIEYKKVYDDQLLQLAKLHAFNLEKLCLNGDQITDKGLQSLSYLIKLHTLNIYKSKNLTHDGLRGISNLTTLRGLCLQCFNISDDGMKLLSKLTLLKKLQIGKCNKITDNGVKFLSNLTSLGELWLMHCAQITDTGLKTISKLTSMYTLMLTGCPQITDHGLESLTTLTLLHKLNLLYCSRITDKSLKLLSSNLALKRPGVKLRKLGSEFWIFE